MRRDFSRLCLGSNVVVHVFQRVMAFVDDRIDQFDRTVLSVCSSIDENHDKFFAIRTSTITLSSDELSVWVP
jgi:hypothetical protein